MFVLADEALSEGTPFNPSIIRDWVQRIICLLGDANTSISAERHEAALLCIDPSLSDVADKELNTKGYGNLFGDPLITKLHTQAQQG